MPLYSALKFFPNSAAASAISFSAQASARKTARALLGIALSFCPPASSVRKNSTCPESSNKKRPNSLMAFARILSISAPECPPASPSIITSYLTPCVSLYSTGISQTAESPPAQLIQSFPSSSESMFSM